MKTLTITRTSASFYTLPADQQRQRAQGTMAYMGKCRKSGELKDIYYTSALKGTVGIWEHQSDEKMARLALENPMWGYIDIIDFHPIYEMDAVNKGIREFLKD